MPKGGGRHSHEHEGRERFPGEVRGDHRRGPGTVQEKVEATHDLAVDEQVVARVATDFLRPPEVVFRAVRVITRPFVPNADRPRVRRRRSCLAERPEALIAA
ncbi:DUF6192 family protein [Streptomyces sp. NPDC005122]